MPRLHALTPAPGVRCRGQGMRYRGVAQGSVTRRNTPNAVIYISRAAGVVVVALFATSVSQWANAYFDHPAVDTTGLQGGFNFTGHWTPRGALEQARPADGAAGGAALDAAVSPSSKRLRNSWESRWRKGRFASPSP